MPTPQRFTLQISRQALAAQDFTTFCNRQGGFQMAPDILPDLLNRLRIEIETEPTHAHGPAADPLVRRYLQTLHRQHWPYAPWACDLKDPFLTTLFYSLADPITFVQRADRSQSVAFLDEQRHAFIRQGCQLIADLGTHAQLSPQRVTQRQNAFGRRITDHL